MDNLVKSEDLTAKAHFAWNMILATHPSTTNKTRLAEFAAAFQRAYGLPFVQCPKHRWKRDFDDGMKELAEQRLIDVKRGATHDWEVTAIYPDRLQAGSILLEM